MKIEKEVSLAQYNTFGIKATADWLVSYYSVDDLRVLISDEYFQECRYLHIGEGSNLLFLANFHGIVLRSGITTIDAVRETDEHIDLMVGAGRSWDELVAHCVAHGYYGAENLSLIPGQVGSAAIQNIGAYGVEIESIVVAVHTVHRRTGEERIFEHDECRYAYRHSIFKEPDMADYIVTYVHLRLSKKPRLCLDYTDIKQYLQAHALEPSLANLRSAIISIRQSKLPDPAVLGNAGSYFMNPIVSISTAESLRAQYPDMPMYPLADGRAKLAAGWLIEQCGLKGHRAAEAGVYDRQALVLVNYGNATGQDIANLAIEVQRTVHQRFGVELQPEVKYIS